MKEIYELRQLRGLAALLVFFYHAMHSGRTAIGITGWPVADFPPLAVLWEGHSGVSLFLVLSGFILAIGTFGREFNYARFLERRLRRIVPLTAIVLLFGLYAVQDLDFGQVLASTLLLRNTPAAFNDPSGITGTLWTVSVEFQFYLVAPFIFAAAGDRGLRFLIPAMFLLFAMKLIVLLPFWDQGKELYRINYFTIVGRANQFLIGVGLAYAVYRRPPDRSKKLLWWIALVVSAAAVMFLLWTVNYGGGVTNFRRWHLILPEFEGLVWSAFLVSFWMANPVRWPPAARSLANVGTVSFGLYVLHYAVQRAFWLNFSQIPGSEAVTNLWQVGLINLAVLAFCLALASASWFCIEKPFVNDDKRKPYVS
ncbi:acyltransferase family protein [Devosia soli]|uniref:acyltransferase family protein n=1 Tax=Devosia soli TaxID=361041 RepID=UPI00137936FF|nr:acyltransferase [Devosia soli]